MYPIGFVKERPGPIRDGVACCRRCNASTSYLGVSCGLWFFRLRILRSEVVYMYTSAFCIWMTGSADTYWQQVLLGAAFLGDILVVGVFLSAGLSTTFPCQISLLLGRTTK